MNLSGSWVGTISFGADYRKPCAPREEIRLALSDSGSAVTGSLTTACEGVLEIRGTLSGSRLTVDLVREDGASIGVLNGVANVTQISVENRDGDPWGYGDPTIGIYLSR
jgi:hypothetical protein